MRSYTPRSVVARVLLILAIVFVGGLTTTLAENQPNPILKEMLEKGLNVGGGLLVKLPRPTLADGLNTADQQKVLNSIGTPSKPLNQILANNPKAPFQLKISPAVGNKNVFHVDMWYVAYGSLDVVAEKQFLKGLGPGAAPGAPAAPAIQQKLPSKSTDLTPEDLAKRNIALTSGIDERYGYSQFEILDKVYLSIASRAVKTSHSESVLTAGYLDERFMNDQQFPNIWQPITQNNLGLPVLGNTKLPYSGAGGYLKVTALKEPAGALFIEGHLVYHEPPAWFSGTSLLRSKIPIMAKDNVETFRKKLKEAMKQKAEEAGK